MNCQVKTWGRTDDFSLQVAGQRIKSRSSKTLAQPDRLNSALIYTMCVIAQDEVGLGHVLMTLGRRPSSRSRNGESIRQEPGVLMIKAIDSRMGRHLGEFEIDTILVEPSEHIYNTILSGELATCQVHFDTIQIRLNVSSLMEKGSCTERIIFIYVCIASSSYSFISEPTGLTLHIQRWHSRSGKQNRLRRSPIAK